MREEVRQKRNKMMLDQLHAKKDFIENLKLGAIILLVISIGSVLIWMMVSYALSNL
jgi:hypothetical protein